MELDDDFCNLILIWKVFKEYDLFNNISRQIIMDEMNQLNVKFYFWEDTDSHKWKFLRMAYTTN